MLEIYHKNSDSSQSFKKGFYQAYVSNLSENDVHLPFFENIIDPACVFFGEHLFFKEHLNLWIIQYFLMLKY